MTNPFDAARALIDMDAQHNRLLRLSFPHEDGPDAMMLVNRLDAYEGLSRDFHFTVEVLSNNARIPLKEVQGKMVTVELVREDGSLRYFNGYVFEFRHVKTDGGFAFYDMVLLPWLAYLRLRRDNYLFHGKTLLEQTEEIFGDYEMRDWDTRIEGADTAFTDACQYDETDYNYLHRRWEERGWHYWYEHRKDGHTLILCDNSFAAKPIDGDTPDIPFQDAAGSIEDDGISSWTPVRRMASGKVALSSFDFKNPHPLNVGLPTINKQGDVPNLEVYEYTGAYGFKTLDEGDKLARQRMEEIEAAGKHFEAAGNDRTSQPGRWFRLIGHYDADPLDRDAAEREFLVLEVRHSAANNYQANADEPSQYRNHLSCIRKKIPWRPGRGFNSIEPKIYGLQTATVVGPKGEEIYTDQYGRVPVQFHWDRKGQFDEKSSAWVRVASTWAGERFGFMAVPRIGQEVIVQFLDGNPDRPIITGRVFNQDNMPPWDLPANKTQTGILTRSSHGGGYDNANAIRFEDKKGQEELWLHAEKDQRIEVENDESHWVGHDRSKTIDHDETVHVKHDRTETVDNNETITVHNNRSERVDHNETISIGDNRSETVGKNESILIGANKTETVAIAKALTIGAGYAVTVGGAMNTAVGLAQFEEVGLNKTVMVGNTFDITAGDEFRIKVGKALFVMKSDGTVLINGTKFNFEASGPVQISGKDVDIN